MSDPGGSITLSHGIAVGIGAAVVAVSRAVWGALTTSHREQIAVLQAENARLTAERDKLGQKVDELTRVQLRMAASILRGRADPKVPDEFEEEMPTAVRALADLMDPNKKPDSHPELKDWDPMASTPPSLRIPRPRK